MRVGIVGSESAKFTVQREAIARKAIRDIIRHTTEQLAPASVARPTIVSGRCHLGGIDIWAVQEGKLLNCPTEEYPPHILAWEGYKRRNIQIAVSSDIVYCITVDKLPEGFRAGGWEKFCYHCKSDKHIKSGGCWTTKYAREIMNRPTRTIVITETGAVEE